eukprot:132152_1
MSFCTNDATKIGVYVSVLLPASSLCLISSILIAYVFIKHIACKTSQEMKISKWLTNAGIAFVVISLFALLFYTIATIINIFFVTKQQALNSDKKTLFFMAGCWMVQFYLLLLISWLRLKTIFAGSALQLSSATVRFYDTILVVEGILMIVVPILGLFSPPGTKVIRLFLGILMGLLFIILMLSIAVLFVRRFIMVYKNIQSDEHFINIVNKTTILTLLSLAITLLTIIGFLLSPTNTTAVNVTLITHIRDIFLLTDMYCKLICVVFSYKYFDKYYRKVCGPLDLKCKKMWFKFVGRDDTKMMAAVVNQSQTEIQSTTSRSTKSSNDSKHTEMQIV